MYVKWIVWRKVIPSYLGNKYSKKETGYTCEASRTADDGEVDKEGSCSPGVRQRTQVSQQGVGYTIERRGRRFYAPLKLRSRVWNEVTENLADMCSEYRSREMTSLMWKKTVAKTVAVRLNDGRAHNRLYTMFGTRQPEQYARKTADNRIVSALRSLRDDRRRPPQTEKRECSGTRRRTPGRNEQFVTT